VGSTWAKCGQKAGDACETDLCSCARACAWLRPDQARTPWNISQQMTPKEYTAQHSTVVSSTNGTFRKLGHQTA